MALFDDVALMVQVKAQCGGHDPMSWATEKLGEAYKQVCKTHENLAAGHIKKLKNDYYGEIEFEPKSYPNRVGLIILAHDSVPYVAARLVPEILTGGFPIHVFSLRDFAMVASRFDTAGDLIHREQFVRRDISAHFQKRCKTRPKTSSACFLMWKTCCDGTCRLRRRK